MARTGKIARLPLAVREELNARLRDNENGQTILAWLNALPVCQERIKGDWNGEPVSDANLSIWRSGGFADWLKEEEQVHRIEKLSELSLRVVKASGGNLSEGLMAIAAGKLQEALEAGCEVEFDEASGKETISGVSVDKLTGALAKIRAMELEAQKLEVKKIEVGQKGQALDLETRKFNHLRVKSFIEWMADERAKELANSDMAADNKLEALGKHLFGDAW
ncbi:hypothetical protein [Prosthecobacter sp.]|uniref:hypothetical protein n=1 Tax=Prosthecobacter sp. TaxID=1965333 RepID=UPI0037830017